MQHPQFQAVLSVFKVPHVRPAYTFTSSQYAARFYLPQTHPLSRPRSAVLRAGVTKIIRLRPQAHRQLIHNAYRIHVDFVQQKVAVIPTASVPIYSPISAHLVY